MKKIQILIFIILPLFIGSLYDYFSMYFHMEASWRYVISTTILLLWLFIGTKFAKLISNSFLAIFSGNILGIASLIIYYLQFEAQNINSIWWLKYFCQCFVFPTFIFTKDINPVITFSTFSISHMFFRNIVGLIGMITLFSIGYFIKKVSFKHKKYAKKRSSRKRH